jgi:hypothetical protein
MSGSPPVMSTTSWGQGRRISLNLTTPAVRRVMNPEARAAANGHWVKNIEKLVCDLNSFFTLDLRHFTARRLAVSYRLH